MSALNHRYHISLLNNLQFWYSCYKDNVMHTCLHQTGIWINRLHPLEITKGPKNFSPGLHPKYYWFKSFYLLSRKSFLTDWMISLIFIFKDYYYLLKILSVLFHSFKISLGNFRESTVHFPSEPFESPAQASLVEWGAREAGLMGEWPHRESEAFLPVTGAQRTELRNYSNERIL